MRNGLLLYNPAAGRFTIRPFVGEIIYPLQQAGWQIEVVETLSGTHATEIAKQAADDGLEAVFVVGGDGTIGRVVRGLVGTETALGIIPAGTQNVLAKEFNLSILSSLRWWALRENAKQLAKASVCKIDIGVCNTIPFMMWAGIGLDGVVSQTLEHRSRIEKYFNNLGYFITILWKASQWSGMQLRIWADGEEVEGRYVLCLTTNIRHYGGFCNISPNAYLDDGILDVWLLSGSSLIDVLRHLVNLSLGKHLKSNTARRIPFESLRVESDSPFMMQLDGDPIPAAQKVEINIMPRALNVLMPHRALHLLQNPSPG